MTTLTLYAASVVTGAFNNPQNLLGDDTSTAAYDASGAAAGTSISHTLRFSLSAVPVGAVINSITAIASAKVDQPAWRDFYSMTMAGADGTTIVKVNETALSTVYADYQAVFDAADFAANGWTDAELRSDTIDWTCSFKSLAGASTYLYWRQFTLVVDYSMSAAAGVDSLFVGALF